jgi:hypothetical protein
LIEGRVREKVAVDIMVYAREDEAQQAAVAAARMKDAALDGAEKDAVLVEGVMLHGFGAWCM